MLPPVDDYGPSPVEDPAQRHADLDRSDREPDLDDWLRECIERLRGVPAKARASITVALGEVANVASDLEGIAVLLRGRRD